MMAEFKQILVPELNLGQLVKVIRAQYLVPAQSYSKVKGQPFKIEELRALETELVASLDYLAGCNTACESEVKVECCPSCERHPENPPELVAGANVH